MDLTPQQYERYSRHLILPEIGLAGQKKLLSSGILLIGAGGLGSPLGLYLAAAGVGKLGIVDFDLVDRSNLQRQVMHGESWIGKPKVDSAKNRIAEINPDVEVVIYREQITSKNAMKLIEPYDLVIDGTDNFPTRYLTNDACALLGKPNVYGSIFRFEGQATVFYPKAGGPCYRCLYPEPPPPGMVPSCAEGGVLGILPGIIGLIQATEAIKLLLGQGSTLIGRFLQYDSLAMKFRELKLHRDPECPMCGDNPRITELIDYEQFCGVSRGEENKEKENMIPQMSVTDLKAKLDAKEDFLLLDVREQNEFDIVRIPGSKLLPLSTFQAKWEEELGDKKDREIVIHCKMGGRSQQACDFLAAQGFTNVSNVSGGVMAWIDRVDPSLPRY